MVFGFFVQYQHIVNYVLHMNNFVLYQHLVFTVCV